MITLKSSREIEIMRRAGRIVHGTLARLLRAPGDAPRGALQALDREPGKARLADLQEDLLRLEKTGAKGSRVG